MDRGDAFSDEMHGDEEQAGLSASRSVLTGVCSTAVQDLTDTGQTT